MRYGIIALSSNNHFTYMPQTADTNLIDSNTIPDAHSMKYEVPSDRNQTSYQLISLPAISGEITVLPDSSDSLPKNVKTSVIDQSSSISVFKSSLLLGCFYLVLLCAAVGIGALTMLLGLTLGHAVLHHTRPNDASYAAHLVWSIRAGALGGCVVSGSGTVIGFILDFFGFSIIGSREMQILGSLAASAAFGASGGAVGVAILRATDVGGSSGMLNVVHAARAGALGMVILAAASAAVVFILAGLVFGLAVSIGCTKKRNSLSVNPV